MIEVNRAPSVGQINYPVVAHSLLQKALFVALSLMVVSYSLGYKINPTTWAIQRTGLIQINSDLVGLKPDVFINGKKTDDPLPVRFGWLFPGTYTVRVEKKGYQPWERVVTVKENNAYNYYHLLLVREEPRQLAMSEEWERKLDSSSLDTRNLRVIDNELWFKKELLRRTSADIEWASWFPDDYHIVFQAGDAVYITEEDGKGTQLITKLPSQKKAKAAFIQDGRILLLEQDGIKQAVELYEPMGKLMWPFNGPSAIVQ